MIREFLEIIRIIRFADFRTQYVEVVISNKQNVNLVKIDWIRGEVIFKGRFDPSLAVLGLGSQVETYLGRSGI